MQAVARAGIGAIAGLRGQEEALAMLRHPRADAQLRVTVRCRGVDVIDAVLEQQLEYASAFSWRMAPSAAAPKMTRVLWWPVRPNGRVSMARFYHRTHELGLGLGPGLGGTQPQPEPQPQPVS